MYEAIEHVVVAGFTGRDRAEVDRHVAELSALGVSAPPTIPAYYLLPREALTQATAITVEHGETSGEAEIALVDDGTERLVTLASDHTDRRAEAVDIGLAKRNCPKLVASDAWRYEDVADHWDALQLRSWIDEGDTLCLYQAGTAGELLPPDALLAELPLEEPRAPFALLCGTVPVLGGLRPAGRFSAELHDPVRDRSLRLDYRIQRGRSMDDGQA